MNDLEWILLGIGSAVIVGAYINHTTPSPIGGPQKQGPPRPTTVVQYGAINYTEGGSVDRFTGFEDALGGAQLTGFPSYRQYAGIPYSNTLGGTFRVDVPGIEGTNGLADQTIIGSAQQYYGDAPLAFSPQLIEAPPWRR